MKQLTPVRDVPPGPPERTRQAEQAELRRRRHGHFAHSYDAGFDLVLEVHQITEPLARRLAAAPDPERFIEVAGELVDAIHALTYRVAQMLARAAAARRCAHLPVDQRGRAVRTIVEAAPRPRRPAIPASALTSGTWAQLLVVHARPYSAPLAALLANAAPDRRGWDTASEQLEAELRLVDQAALRLERRLTTAETSTPVCPPPHPVTQAQRREARQAGIGVTYGEGFDLTAEIEAIASPLARRAAGLPIPNLAREINAFIDAIHESVSELAVLLARADAARRCGHVPIDLRGTAQRYVIDLTPRPARPAVSEAAIARGQWVQPLLELAAPYREPLSELLETAASPTSVSEALSTSLKRIDKAAAGLSRKLDRAERADRDAKAAPDAAAKARAAQDKAKAQAEQELARLGVPR